MTIFSNVTIIKKANIYFDGQVTSRTVEFSDGTKKTLGFMQVGEYTFGTDCTELMEILAGNLEVLLPESKQWQVIKAGQSFEIPANVKFKVNIKKPTDYCCSYL